MTGKFTENAHNLGYATGRILRRLLLSGAASATNNDHAADPASCLSGSPASCLPGGNNFTSTIGVDSIHLSSVPSALSDLVRAIFALPNRYRHWWWNLLLSDPLHVLVETLLIVMCIALVLLQRRSDWRFSQERKKLNPTEEEVEELLREWKEEKRKPLGNRKEGTIGGGKKKYGVGNGELVVERIEGSRLYFERPEAKPSKGGGADKDIDSSDNSKGKSKSNPVATDIPESALNFATLDYLSSTSNRILRSVARKALKHYGCGSCGPRGFYGTIDAHLEAEEAVSEFLGTEGAILYSDGASAATSTVAAFAKRGDLLIVDEGVSEALLVGVTLSRANVRYFRHNDVKDLRKVLEKVAAQDVTLKRKAIDQRRFLVVEGLYRNWGTLAPLNEIVKLKEEFCYRLILDDSHAIGVLGQNGKGSLEHAGLKPMVHAEILTFGLENALGSVGGMTVGSEEVVDHQRLSGAGYCFSASAPPFLSKVCLAGIRRLEGRMDEVRKELMEEDDGQEKEKKEAGTSKEDDKSAGGPKNESLELQRQHFSRQRPDDVDTLSGHALLSRLQDNIAVLYSTLTNASHPHALKLRGRLSVTSDPLSPVVYLRLSDDEGAGRTRAEQTSMLDKIARHCLVKGGVAVVSTGGHVKKYLQLVPEPSLRLATHVGQTREEVEALVRALGKGVEEVLARGEGEDVAE